MIRHLFPLHRDRLQWLLSKAYVVFLTPGAFLAVILIRVISPLVVLRFGTLEQSRIGGFVAMTEQYLCERDAGMRGKGNFDIFYYQRGPICNKQLHKMWKRKLHIFHYGRIVEIIDKVNRLFPGHEKHVIKILSFRDVHNLLEQIPTHLIFTPKEELRGKALCRKLGIPDGKDFVCLHVRDASYLNTVYPDKDWTYLYQQNCSLNNYLPAAHELTARGYYVLRMGAVVEKKLDIHNPMIIDYASFSRSDFLDIYLCSRCRFFLASPSGLASVALMFRKPVAWPNFCALEHVPSYYKDTIFIPKKIRSKKNGRYLTFRETISSGVGRIGTQKLFEEAGVDIVENTPEEILALVKEIDARLKGIWQASPEDEKLQQRFWALFKDNPLHSKIITGRIGAEFLRQNIALLDL